MVTNKDDLPIYGEDYPARRVLDLIAQRWTAIVIYCLTGGVRRFGELESQIPGISKKVLTDVLRRLEADGVVTRKVYAEVPPRTEYRLTTVGRRLHEPIQMICQWALDNPDVLKKIERNRQRSSE
ncbi:MAG TPA: transcriptional regulator [Planctomycetaceae bacterium]|nr:transcriptional regulator [Planctomycetaceae bacterium]